MLITTGKVSGGAIEVEAGSLPEGTKVTILAAEDNEVFQLGSEDEARLLEAVAEAERGEVVSAEAVLEKIRKRERFPTGSHRRYSRSRNHGRSGVVGV